MYRLTPPSDGAIRHFRTVRTAGRSAHTYHHAPVAQGIEHRIPNPGVACSNHAGGTMKSRINRSLAVLLCLSAYKDLICLLQGYKGLMVSSLIRMELLGLAPEQKSKFLFPNARKFISAYTHRLKMLFI